MKAILDRKKSATTVISAGRRWAGSESVSTSSLHRPEDKECMAEEATRLTRFTVQPAA